MNFLRLRVTINGRYLKAMLHAVSQAVTALAVSAVLAAQASEPPPGWIKAGNARDDYDVGTDETVRRHGQASAYVKARVPNPRGFGTLMQRKRVPWRASGRVRDSADPQPGRDLAAIEDETLIRRVARGDDCAMAELVARYERRLSRCA